jgi:hypothetical protein
VSTDGVVVACGVTDNAWLDKMDVREARVALDQLGDKV